METCTCKQGLKNQVQTINMQIYPPPTSKKALKVGGSPLVHALHAASQPFL